METTIQVRTNKTTAILRAIIWVGILEFLLITIWALVTGEPLMDTMNYLFTAPWGRVATMDLLLGLMLFSIIIYLNESSKKNAALWILASFCIGNPLPAVYLLLNLEKIKGKLEK